MGTRFRPPREIPDIGPNPPAQQRFKAWLRAVLVEIAEDMAALGRDSSDTLIAQETIDVDVPSLRRVTPPVGGMGVRLPPPSAENAGKSVRLMIEAPVGELTVVSRPGIGDDGKVFQPTVNGEPRATFSVSGLVTLTSNGVNDWKTDAEFPAESPTVANAEEDQAGIDATYHLATVHPDLPNARVADDSTEISVDNSSPGLVSWFLNTASVAFSKLNNLAGLSVLGRASSSSGVMAAITATAGDQHLVSNAAGTALTWVSNRSQQFDDTVSGTLDPYLLPSAFKSGDSLVWVITGDTTVNRIRMADDSIPPDGTVLYLSLRDQSGGSAPGHQLILPDTGAVTVNGSIRTPGQVQGTSPGPSYIMRSEEEGCTMIIRAGNWRLVGGTAAQAIEGDITVAAGNGSTRDAQITAGAIVNADVNASAAIAQTKLGATTGFSVKASGSAATTSAEPIVTYSASANMSAERVTTSSTSITVSTSVASQIEFQRAALTGDVTASANSNATTIANDAVTNAKLANVTSPSLKGRTTASTGDPEDLTLVNSTTNTWNTATGGSISVERAALVGDITASANSNTTAIAAGVIVDADVNASAAIAMTKTGALTGDVTKASGSDVTAIAAGVIVDADVNASAAIALSKLATQAQATFVMRIVLAGTGVPTAGTATNAGQAIRNGDTEDIACVVGIQTITIAAGTKVVRLNPPSDGDVEIAGFIHGSSNTNAYFKLQKIGGDGRIILRHEDSVNEATAANRCSTPFGLPFIIGRTSGDMVDVAHIAGRFTPQLNAIQPAQLAAVTTLNNSEAVPFMQRIAFTASGATGTMIDVTIWNADAPFARRIQRAVLRVSVAAGTAAALRTASGGGGSVVLPDVAVTTQTFDTSATGVFEDAAAASATVSASGSLFLNVDRAVTGEIVLTCVRT